MQNFYLHRGVDRSRIIENMTAFAGKLGIDKVWKVTFCEHKKPRSNSQNSYLWGVVYSTILKSCSDMDGWSNDDLHEFFLGECFGWEEKRLFGRKRLCPIKRSSKLNTKQFSDYWQFIQQYMAERGVYIPDPNEQYDDSRI